MNRLMGMPGSVLAGVVVVLAVAGLAWALRNDSEPSEDQVAAPTATTSPEAPRCPVDEAICEFVQQVEFEYRKGDPLNLVSPKSDHYGEIGIVDAGIGSWRDAPYYPRVIGIGCSMDAGGGVCGQAFSLVLTAFPEDQQEERISRVLLGFMRDGNELPIVTTNRLIGGPSNIVNSGAIPGDCTLAGYVGRGECLGTHFFAYESGPAVPRSTAPPTPTPVPGNPLEGVDIVEAAPGMQSSIGYDTVVYYSTGCFQCGRPHIPNLFRTYRDSSGQLVTDDLLGPLFAKTGGYPSTFAAEWDTGHLVVLICTTGYCGGEGDPSPDAQVALYRSRDGGVTWAFEESSLPVQSFFTGMVDGRVIVLVGKREGLDFVWEHFRFPAHQDDLEPPQGIGPATPYPDREGRVGWLASSAPGGFFANNGLVLVPPVPDMRLVGTVPLGGGRFAQWINDQTQVFGMFHGTGELAGAFRHAGYADFRGQLGNGLLYGTIQLAEPFGFGVDGGGDACKESQPFYPALVNWNTGSIHPIIELGDCVEGRHKAVNAMLSRPVVRVNTGGDCLNVRKEATTSSESLGCFADGVLLTPRVEGVTPVEGWLAVLTPALELGWVAEGFVTR